MMYVNSSCESLSKFCIFACFKNRIRNLRKKILVVNRFQNFVSLHALKTAIKYAKSKSCCESLSKFCIFACFKNYLEYRLSTYRVVNRFQNFVSLHALKTRVFKA